MINVIIRLCFFGTDHEEYIVITQGDYPPLLSTGFAILVNQELSSFVAKHFSPNLLHAVVIFYKAGCVETKEYNRLDLADAISAKDNLESIDATGLKLWHFDKRYLFVSGEVKDLLEKAEFKGIYFTCGFGNFGA